MTEGSIIIACIVKKPTHTVSTRVNNEIKCINTIIRKFATCVNFSVRTLTYPSALTNRWLHQREQNR